MYDWLHPEIDIGTWYSTGFRELSLITELILARIERKLLKMNQIVNIQAIVAQMIPTRPPSCMIGYILK